LYAFVHLLFISVSFKGKLIQIFYCERPRPAPCLMIAVIQLYVDIVDKDLAVKLWGCNQYSHTTGSTMDKLVWKL